MSRPRELTNPQRDDALRSAVEKRTPLIVTLQGADQWILARSRFVPRDPGGGKLCIEPLVRDCVAVEGRTPVELPASCRIGVTFRLGHHKCMFTTSTLGRQRVALNPELKVDTILIRKPDAVQQLQRRAYERTPVPDDFRLTVSLTPIGEAAARLADRGPQTIEGIVLDLSAGGLQAVIPHPPAWSPMIEDYYRAVLAPTGGAPIEVDVLYRHCNAEADGRIAWGFQLVGLESTEAGRRALTSLTGLLYTLTRLQPQDARLSED